MTILQSSKLWMVAASFSFGALAHAENVCTKIDLNGNFTCPLYKDEPGSQPISIKQDGCSVTVTDPNGTLKVYQFDLSGQTSFRLPQAVLDKNHGSQFAYDSLQSLRGILDLKTDTSRYSQVTAKVSVQERLPAEDDNKVDTTIGLKAELLLDGEMGSNNRFEINSIDIYKLQARMLSVHSFPFVGPLGNAFKAGANYLLGFADEVDGSRIVLPGLFPITRIEKK